MAEDTTINGLSTALAATAAADDLLPIWDTSAGAMKKHAAAYVARSDGASGHKLITGSGRELTVPATGTAVLQLSGTWTPVLTTDAASPPSGLTYTSAGTWAKAGNIVHIYATVNVTVRGSGGSGNIILQGWQASIGGSNSATTPGSLAAHDLLGQQVAAAKFNTNGNCYFYSYGSGGAETIVAVASLTTGYLEISATLKI
jgi:hypothetical protein